MRNDRHVLARLLRVVALLSVFVLIAASCGDDDDAASTDDSGATTADDSAADDGGSAGDDGTASGDDATDDSGGDSGSSDVPADLDAEGVMQFVGPDFTLYFGTGFDPTTKDGPGAVYDELMYGTLLRRTADSVYHDGLAQADATEIVDPQTIKIELFPGQTYSDGTELTAQHVADALARNVRAGKAGNMRIGQLSALKATPEDQDAADGAIVVDGPTSLTLNLTQPIAGAFFDLLAHEETSPYLIPDVGLEPGAEGYDDAVAAAIQENPVGAGPYMLESLSENDQLVLVKYDGYVHADSIRVPTVIFNHATSDSRLNALNAGLGTFSASNLIEAQQVGRAGYDYIALPNPDKFGWLWTVCMGPLIPGETDGTAVRDPLPNGDPHPLTIPEVRQALNYALDKPLLIRQFFPDLPEGSVPVMDQLWQNDSPFANPDLVDSYPYNPDRALELLDSVGVDPSDINLTFFTTPGASQTTGELLQQQWDKIGVSLELQPSTDVLGDFFYGRAIDFFGNLAGASARFFTDKVTRNWTSGTGATCNPSVEAIGGDPKILDLITELNGLEPGSDETIPLWQDIAEIIIDGAFGIFFDFPPDILLWDFDHLGASGDAGFTGAYSQLVPNQQGAMWPDMHQVYIKTN